MNAREKDLHARFCLGHLGEVTALWHRKEWNKLAVVVEYAQRGVPAAMSKTDPLEYRRLCHGLCEYHIRGFDNFNLARIRQLAAQQERDAQGAAEALLAA